MVELFEEPFEGSKEVSYFGLKPLYYKAGVVKTVIGDMPVSVSREDYIKYLFIRHNDMDIFGYYAGFTALNKLHGTTQVPVLQEVRSNEVKEIQEYGVGFGVRFKIYPSDILITHDNYIYLQVLDVVENWYDYFEENRLECIRYVVKRQNLGWGGFEKHLDYYSSQTRRFLKDVFA